MKKSKDGESSGEKKWDRERGPKCFNCQKWGHIKARCPEAAETINYGGQDQENGDQTQWQMEGKVNGKPSKKLLLDSGATRTFVHPRMLTDKDMLGWKRLFKTASDNLVQLPMARARIEVEGKQYDLTVAVSDSIELDALLGNDIPDFPKLLMMAARNYDSALVVTRAQTRK